MLYLTLFAEEAKEETLLPHQSRQVHLEVVFVFLLLFMSDEKIRELT